MVKYDKNGRIIEEKRGDLFIVGFLLGLILPLLTHIFLLWREVDMTFLDSVVYVWKVLGNMLFVEYFILSMLSNLVAFFPFYKLEKWNICRGIVSATFTVFALFVIKTMFRG